MSSAVYAVYGASGYGREVLPLVREQLLDLGIRNDRLVFVDDHLDVGVMNGHRVVRYNDFLSIEANEHYAVVAIADSTIRQKLADRCLTDGVLPWTVRAKNVVVMDEVELGAGAILSPFVTMTSNIRIGRQFHANIYSYIAHDCVIGDFVTFAPGVQCNGNVVIEDHAYIGAGAVLKQGNPGRPLVIGRAAVIGMGAVVTKNVDPGVTVVGNPARVMIKD